jgi:hypothetical protein
VGLAEKQEPSALMSRQTRDKLEQIRTYYRTDSYFKLFSDYQGEYESIGEIDFGHSTFDTEKRRAGKAQQTFFETNFQQKFVIQISDEGIHSTYLKQLSLQS